jgi:hypothetical protein
MTDDQKMLKHLHHPLYKQALNEFAAKQQTQIKKGAEKYDEPLNHESWTYDQLVDHADEEVVDLKHYLTTIRNKFRDMEEDILFLLDCIDESEYSRKLEKHIVYLKCKYGVYKKDPK